MQAVYISKVADIELVYKGKVHLGISDVQMPLKITCILHSQDHLFLRKVVFAENL